RRLAELDEIVGIPDAVGAVRLVVDVRAVDRSKRSDRRGLVARHAGAEKPGNRNRRDDADDRDDDQQLDQSEPLLTFLSHGIFRKKKGDPQRTREPPYPLLKTRLL